MVSVRKRPWHQDSYLLPPLLLGTFLPLLLSTINSSTIPPYIFITYPLGTHILRTSSGDDFILCTWCVSKIKMVVACYWDFSSLCSCSNMVVRSNYLFISKNRKSRKSWQYIHDLYLASQYNLQFHMVVHNH